MRKIAKAINVRKKGGIGAGGEGATGLTGCRPVGRERERERERVQKVLPKQKTKTTTSAAQSSFNFDSGFSK